MAPPTSDASPVSSRGVFQFVQLSHPDDAALTRHKVRSHASRNPRARQERVAKHQREQLSKRSLIRSDQTLPKDAFKPRRHNALSEPTTEGFMFSSKHVPLQYPLAESWDDHCLPFVMNKSFFDMGKTVYNAIPFVITKARERSALSLVCNAVGSAYMANAIRSVDSATNRLRAYTTALVAINSAIRDPQQYKSDDTLLGVWLLSLYELLLGAQESTNSDVEYSGWDIHSRGMTELLRLRSAENFATRNGRNVFWIVFNTVQIQALLTDIVNHQNMQ
ncbi:hypothetical protein FQN54_003686 [Arachnomyces sp. PD_36]|nr:hypothetical protein FQN54_003686 [Arachnomyces sp. PD_36]